MTKKPLVFLGGTCFDTNWRNELIAKLKNPAVAFNPVAKDWSEEHQRIENEMKEKLPVHVFVFTPQMKGMYAIAEATVSVLDRTKVTIFCVLDTDSSDPEKRWGDEQLHSWAATQRLWMDKGGCFACSLDNVAYVLDNVEYVLEGAIDSAQPWCNGLSNNHISLV